MEAVIAGVIAICGTLVGSIVTYLFQRRSAHRTEQFMISTRLREERMTVYSGFAGTLLEFRSAQYSRALQASEGKGKAAYAEARTTSQRLRVSAWQALYRVRLLADDPETKRLAENAMTLVAEMHELDDRSALAKRSDDVRIAVEDFITAAGSEVAWGTLIKHTKSPEL